jgi:hypothetical protein
MIGRDLKKRPIFREDGFSEGPVLRSFTEHVFEDKVLNLGIGEVLFDYSFIYHWGILYLW